MNINDIWKQSYFGTDKLSKRIIKLLKSSTELYNESICEFAIAIKTPPNPLEVSIYESAKSISLLAENNQCREAYIISRALLEGVITHNYIGSENEEVLENYYDYLLNKQYRNIKKSISVNDKVISVEVENTMDLGMDENRDIKLAVEKFTGKKGNPKTRWVKDNLLSMIKVIDDKSNINIKYMMAGMNYIYSDASEALHGTLYGCMFHYGYDQLGYTFNPLAMKKNFHNTMHLLLFIVTNLIIEDTISMLYGSPELDKIGLPKNYYDKSKMLLTKVKYVKKKLEKCIKENKSSHRNHVIMSSLL